jgi:hypothetical protein
LILNGRSAQHFLDFCWEVDVKLSTIFNIGQVACAAGLKGSSQSHLQYIVFGVTPRHWPAAFCLNPLFNAAFRGRIGCAYRADGWCIAVPGGKIAARATEVTTPVAMISQKDAGIIRQLIREQPGLCATLKIGHAVHEYKYAPLY